ncbi:hypothetical protein OEZ86_003565 [Tetradesmus obliquus]|nr:hypothetical protein OEZ86_003565 [Tetradesmus obliquus]
MERSLLRAAGTYNPQKPPRHPRTLVNALFGLILQSTVTCCSCRHVSASFDPAMDLSLELGGCASVEDALRRFTAVERLDGDNKYRCEGCKQLMPAVKQMTIYDDPNVLVIHLKRFDGIFGGKVSRAIDFGMTLDLEPFVCSRRRCRTSSSSMHSNGSAGSAALLNGCSSSNSQGGPCSSNGHSSAANNACGCSKQQQQQQWQRADDTRSSRGEYVLHGVLVHDGFSANSGHYYSYVRDGVPPHGHWHCMNDSQVYRVAEATVLKQAAYVLFYRLARQVFAQLLGRSGGGEEPAAQ